MATHGCSEGSSSSIDLNSVRETLSYIESDLNGPQYPKLRSIVGLALAEIGHIESKAEIEQLRAVHFVPVT